MGKFKMKGFSAGKGTGSAKTHLRRTEVSLNQGPELYSGEIPGGPGYISQDDPMYYEMMYPSGGYSGTASETSPGSQVRSTYERALDKRAAGGSTKLSPASSRVYSPDGSNKEYHEGYHGIKDESAGYDAYTLGAPNEKEKQERQRFQSDLSKNLRDYNRKLPIGDYEINNETFDYWAQLNNIDPFKQEHDPRVWDNFVGNVNQVNNLSNELKMGAEAGYKPWYGVPDYIDFNEGPYAINKERHYVNMKNKEEQTKSSRNRQSDHYKAELEEWLANGWSISSFGDDKLERIRGGTPSRLSHGARVDTEIVNNNTKWLDALVEEENFSNMTWREKRKYKKEKTKEEERKVQEQKEIEANLPDEGSEKDYENLNEDEEINNKQKEEEYIPQSQQQEYIPQSQQRQEEPVVEKEPVVEEKNKKPEEHIKHEEKVKEVTASSGDFDPADTNQDGEVDKWEAKAAKRAAMFADASDPASSMSKHADYSKPNPFQRGSDEYYKWQRGKVGHRSGLTKKMFNIYSK